jgi:hypothetical protein
VVKFDPGQKKAIKIQTTYDYWYRIQPNLGDYFFLKKEECGDFTVFTSGTVHRELT